MNNESKLITVGLTSLNKLPQPIGVEPRSFSVQLEESIHSILPTAKLQIKDITGAITESLAIQKGNELGIEIGYDNIITKNKFAVINTSTSPAQGELYAPNINISLVHNIVNQQTKKSFAYRGRLSNIIQQVLPQFVPDINDSGNSSIWYQANETDIEFINRISKYLYSENSGGSPFFIWIDLDNILHVRNVNSMELEKPAIELYLRNSTQDTDFRFDVKQLQKIDDSSDKSGILNGIDTYTIDSTTGSIIKIPKFNNQFPFVRNNPTDKILKTNSLTNTTKTIFQFYKGIDKGIIDNQKGEIINSKKETYFPERFACQLIGSEHSVRLRAGKTVKIHAIPAINRDSVKESLYLTSSKFLIEKKITSWDCDTGKLTTFFVLARRTASLSSQIPIYNDFD